MSALDRTINTGFLDNGDFGFRRLTPDPDRARLEKILDKKGMKQRPEVQELELQAALGWPGTRVWARERLQAAIDAEEMDAVRNPDEFRPYAPNHLLNDGDLHVFNQVDGVERRLRPDVLLRGTLICGPQGGGKTRLVAYIIRQILRNYPSIRVFMIDPKGELVSYADDFPTTVHVPGSEISLDFGAPEEKDRAAHLRENLQHMSGVCHLIQGTSLLYEAGEIALPQLDVARRVTGQNLEVCIRDIRLALPMVPDTSDYKRQGFLQSTQTATLRIELGSGKLFVCRKGASMRRLFGANPILTTQDLVDPWPCEMLLLTIFNWLRRDARSQPTTNELRALVVIDDAHLYMSKEVSAVITAPLEWTLAILRSSGVGVILVSHLPSQIQPGVLALCQLMLIVGGVHGGPDREVIAKALSLNHEQERQLGRMQPREVVGFYAGSRWPLPIHGWTADMPDPRPDWSAIAERSKAFIASLGILPYQNLWEYREVVVVQNPPAQPQVPAAGDSSMERPTAEGLPANANRLLWDCISYPFDKYTARLDRLELSGRDGQTARRVLEQSDLVRSLDVGQAIYLIVTRDGYKVHQQAPHAHFSEQLLEHNYLEALARHYLLQEPSVDRVELHVPVNDKGACVDMVVYRKDGSMEAWELTISTGNVTGNAIKCGGEGFRRIVFLCRDHAVRQAVSKRIERSGLPPDLKHRLRYVLFSTLTRKDQEARRERGWPRNEVRH